MLIRSRPNALSPTVSYDASQAHEFIHDDWQVIEERLRGWAGPERQFVYGAFIDEPLVMDVNEDFDATCTGAGDSRYFYHQDRIYSVIGLTDAAGTIVEAYEYDPYGRRYVFNDGDADGAVEFDGSDTVTLDAASAFGNPYVFTGRRWEDETGLHYYRRRWYDAPRARFLSRDPIGYGDGPHLYQYVKSNPVIYFDPKGLLTRVIAVDHEVIEDWKLRYNDWVKQWHMRKETYKVIGPYRNQKGDPDAGTVIGWQRCFWWADYEDRMDVHVRKIQPRYVIRECPNVPDYGLGGTPPIEDSNCYIRFEPAGPIMEERKERRNGKRRKLCYGRQTDITTGSPWCPYPSNVGPGYTYMDLWEKVSR